MAQKTSYTSQFFHPAMEPLDSSNQVQSVDDLTDATKVAPYKGKIVHVKSEGKLYLCISASKDASGTAHSTWTPFAKDDGTAFYLRASDVAEGSLDAPIFEIKAVRDGAGGKGRIEVTYPAT